MIPVLNTYRHPRIWIRAAALLALNLAGLRAQAPSRQSDQEYDSGVQRQKRGDLAGARQAYEAALKLAPRRIDALSNLGLTYAGLREYHLAVRSFQQALAVAPGQPAVLFNLGITYLQAGEYENARRTLAELVRAQAGNFQARHYLGVSLLKLNRIPEGIAELEAVVTAHPEDLDALYTLCSAYIQKRQLEKAQQLIEGPLNRQDTAEAHMLEGSYYMAVRDYRQAVLQFRRSQELNATIPDLALRLGTAYAMTGSQETAISLFEARLQEKPSDFEALGFLGWLYMEADRLDDAQRVLEKAHHLKPDDPDVLCHLGRLARKRGEFTQAAELLERVVALKPRDVPAHVLLAETYFRLKRTADGKREREIVRQLNAEEQVRRSQAAGMEASGREQP
jgi:tetratricopeptide (TPR) repeat protein